MAYTALYRKFRPLTFDEFAGQEHITRTLKNQIIAGRVGHAYLFSGGRGTGKTSAAKILARAVNCLNPQNGEPCNKCEICQGIINGSLTDVVEMDAASNRNIDDIRKIREEVMFLPTKAKYRVYIIDEVHMLTQEASNALLKTLEEPPEHVKFILATTEPQKLPATILSRCQRFDFKRIPNEDIKERLKKVSKDIKVTISEEALNTIAVLSEGAMRDALSILERCLQDGDTEITDEKIKDLVGIPKFEYIYQTVKSIIEKNSQAALDTTQTIIDEGKDLSNFLWEIIKYLKDVLVFKSKGKLELYSKEDLAKIEELSNETSKEELFYLIKELSDIENELKWASQKAIMFQAEIIKLTIDSRNTGNIEDVEKRLTILEKKIEDGNFSAKESKSVARYIPNTEEAPLPKQETVKKEKKEPAKKKEEASMADVKSTDYWPKVLNHLKTHGKPQLFALLSNTKAVELNDMQVGIVGLNAMSERIIKDPDNNEKIKQAILEETGKDMQVKVEQIGNVVKKSKQTSFDIPINIIDE